MSIWRSGDRVYLNLNGPTIGVSYETRWEGGRALPITRAQLESGRRLTDYLRDKWSIAPDMCLTHGLISVNPRRHLIGHHVDWARGFPFDAYGLPDLYLRPAPAVALFGFGYDEPFLEVMGEPWPGVLAAEQELRTEAGESGRTIEDVRAERSRLYDRWLAEQTRDAEAASEGNECRCGREPRARRERRRLENDGESRPAAARRPGAARGPGADRRPPHRPRRRDQQGRLRAPRGEERGVRLPAQRVHPRSLLPGHGANDPAAEGDPPLPRRRRDRHLRLRHRPLRQHVQRRDPPHHGRRPDQPQREAGVAGSGADPADPGAQAPHRQRGAGLLGARRAPRAGGPAHLPRGHPAQAPAVAGLPGDGHQRGPGGHLLRARGAQLHRHRGLLRRRDVQRHPRLPVDPLDHGLGDQGRGLHRPQRGRGGGRARHPGEGASRRRVST